MKKNTMMMVGMIFALMAATVYPLFASSDLIAQEEQDAGREAFGYWPSVWPSVHSDLDAGREAFGYWPSVWPSVHSAGEHGRVFGSTRQ